MSLISLVDSKCVEVNSDSRIKRKRGMMTGGRKKRKRDMASLKRK